MAVIPRFQQTAKGAVLITGNVLGLAGDVNGEGILNFTVSNPPAPPSGSTTTTWQNNSSSAFVNLPSGSTVLYAELSWSAQFNSSISSFLNNSITFETPLGSNTVSPDPTTSQSLTASVGSFYMRSQNVTSLLQAAGAGMYTVRGVPSLILGANNYVGWCLVVVFSNSSQPYRNLSTWVMLEQVSGGGGNVDVPISNFATPPMGPVTGRLVVSAGGGNSHIGGDFLQFGLNTSSLSSLVGPNNPITNFFCSQINNGNSLSANVGQVDTSGTFGTANSKPPAKAAVGDRNSFDITNVNASSGLTNNQTNGVVRFGTVSDTYEPIALGIQIDVNSPNLTPIVKSADRTYSAVGETITYTVTFKNNGVSDALNAVFIDTVPSGTTFIPGSVTINNISNSGNPASPGISLGNITVNQSTTITFKVTVDTLPSPNPIINTASIGYNFTPGPGLPTINAIETSNSLSTLIREVNLTQTKSVDKSFADVGSILTYIIEIKNNGNTTTDTIVLSDTIPNDTSFVSNSVTVNGAIQSGVNPSPPGFTLPNSIGAGKIATVTFKVNVLTIPSPNPIPNTSTSIGIYTIDPSLPTSKTTSTNSNMVFTKVNTATFSNITKFVNKSVADCGDIITYTISMPNSGNVTAQNIIFKDTIPNGTTFVTNSVTVNGVTQIGSNPSSGITVPNIIPGNTSTITFQVQVQCQF